jgi:hypothetical protein
MRINSPRETEVARNQITSSIVANGIMGILEEHMKVKNRQATIARSSKRMPVFIGVISELLQSIFADPADICDESVSETAH